MEQHEEIGTKEDLVKYRLATAKEDLNAAKVLYEIKSYKAANNRAYYAIYHSINALHGLDGNGYKKHKDAIAKFNQFYVKNEIFPREIGKKVARAEEIRHASDYDDFYIASAKDTETQIQVAEELIELVEKYCRTRIGIE